MVSLEDVRDKVGRREYEFTKHAVDQSVIRDIQVKELEEALLGRSEVIEDYPDDERGPSCLILVFTSAGRPLHVQVSYPSRLRLKIITLYEPDPTLWIEFRQRKVSG
jgi:hypothetical protein